MKVTNKTNLFSDGSSGPSVDDCRKNSIVFGEGVAAVVHDGSEIVFGILMKRLAPIPLVEIAQIF